MVPGYIITRPANGGFEYFVTSVAPQVRDAAFLGTAAGAMGRGSARSTCGRKCWPCLSCTEVAVFASISADMKAIAIELYMNASMLGSVLLLGA